MKKHYHYWIANYGGREAVRSAELWHNRAGAFRHMVKELAWLPDCEGWTRACEVDCREPKGAPMLRIADAELREIMSNRTDQSIADALGEGQAR